MPECAGPEGEADVQEAAGRASDVTAASAVSGEVLTARLAVGLAHDFRNYLMGIVGFAELAAQAISGDHPARGYLASVDAFAAAASDAVTRLLDVVRDGGEEPRLIDLADRLRTLLRILDRVTPAAVGLECDTPEALHVRAMPALVDQAVANLVLNAADARTPKGGTIRVRLMSRPRADGRGCEVVIEVTADGAGITPAQVQHLFDRDFTTKRTGCGLGLPLMDAIAAAHGGRVEVESTPGCGATFRVVIPLVAVTGHDATN